MRIFLIFLTTVAIAFGQDRVFVKFSKKRAYLNEPIVAKVYIKTEKKPIYATTRGFKSKLLYAKLLSKSSITKNSNEYTKTYTYLLFPQATGTIELDQLIAKVSLREEKTGFLVSHTLLSKYHKLEVYSLPSNLKISGNLSMQLIRDNSKIAPNKPINFTLKIEGFANIDDIKPFKLPIKNATYYSDKPSRTYSIKNGKLSASFKQKFTVITQESFTVKPIKLSYFNTPTQLKETISTKKVTIKIDKPILKKREYIVLLIGVILGILTTFSLRFIKRKAKPSSFKMAIKKAKNDKEIYKLLLPFANEEKYKDTIKKLEENIYKKAKHKINKKSIST